MPGDPFQDDQDERQKRIEQSPEYKALLARVTSIEAELARQDYCPAKGGTHQWEPVGFVQVECGGFTPLDRCAGCQAERMPFHDR